MTKLIPVVLSGGSGSRLWPVSRAMHPKPFMKLADGESLLHKAYARAIALPGVTDVLTVTNREFFFKTADEFLCASKPGVNSAYVLEPFGRNTAAAVATAALMVERSHGGGAVLLVLPSDHLISNAREFEQCVATAVELASQGRIATFGIRPATAETGYGYIEFDGTSVKRFVEKPDLETAQEYISSGRFLWNSGMFCFQAQVMLREMAAHCPGILESARASLDDARIVDAVGVRQVELQPSTFGLVPQDSIDYAVMERTTLASVVAADFGWSDIGSWTAISDLAKADADGNRVTGHAVLHDTQNCYVQSDRLVGAVGVQDLVVIDTPDALLIASRDSAQQVKHLVERLKAQGHEAHKMHRTVHRPWGTYTVLEEAPGFKIKRIEVKPGASLSLQMHHHRSEHWIVVSGQAIIVNGEEVLHLRANQGTYIPAGAKHRLTNKGEQMLVLIEVQSGAYLGEDDIVRFEDTYGRV